MQVLKLYRPRYFRQVFARRRSVQPARRFYLPYPNREMQRQFDDGAVYRSDLARNGRTGAVNSFFFFLRMP